MSARGFQRRDVGDLYKAGGFHQRQCALIHVLGLVQYPGEGGHFAGNHIGIDSHILHRLENVFVLFGHLHDGGNFFAAAGGDHGAAQDGAAWSDVGLSSHVAHERDVILAGNVFSSVDRYVN